MIVMFFPSPFLPSLRGTIHRLRSPWSISQLDSHSAYGQIKKSEIDILVDLAGITGATAVRSLVCPRAPCNCCDLAAQLPRG